MKLIHPFTSYWAETKNVTTTAWTTTWTESSPNTWIQKVLSEGVQLWRFLGLFLVDEGGDDPNTPLKVGHHRHDSKTPFKWVMAQHWILAWYIALWFFRGSGPVLLRNPKFLWFFFSEGSRCPATPPHPPPPTTPLDPPMISLCVWHMLCSNQKKS